METVSKTVALQVVCVTQSNISTVSFRKGFRREQEGSASESIHQYHAAFILITIYIKCRNEHPVDNAHTAAKPYERIVT